MGTRQILLISFLAGLTVGIGFQFLPTKSLRFKRVFGSIFAFLTFFFIPSWGSKGFLLGYLLVIHVFFIFQLVYYLIISLIQKYLLGRENFSVSIVVFLIEFISIFILISATIFAITLGLDF